MRENETFRKSQASGPKKFLYTGPRKDSGDEDQWNFAPKAFCNSNNNKPVDLAGVWSIQRNVSLKNGSGLQASSSLPYNSNRSFYSRHGGIKDSGKDTTAPSAGIGGKQETLTWTGARGSSYPTFGQNSRSTSSPTSNQANRGYGSRPSSNHFNHLNWQPDENEF